MGQLGESFPIGKLCSLHYGKMWVCSHWDLMTWLHKKRSMIWNFYPAQLGTDSAMSAYIIYHHWVRFCMTHSTRISPPFSFLSIIIHFAFPCLWEVCSLLNKIQNNVDVFVHQRPVLWNICYEYNVWVCLGQGKAHTLGFMSSGYTFGVWTMEVCSWWWYDDECPRFSLHAGGNGFQLLSVFATTLTYCATQIETFELRMIRRPHWQLFIKETSKLLPELNCTLTTINFTGIQCKFFCPI